MTACDALRTLLHARLDGELTAEQSAAIEAHLSECPECRAVAAGLDAVRIGLRDLPERSLPAAALEEVLDRTVRAGRRHRSRGLTALWPAWAAAAAVAALALLLWRAPLAPRAAGEPSPAELARATHDARVVLSLASRAVRRAERTASERVLAGEVVPALRRLPIHWAPKPEQRKS